MVVAKCGCQCMVVMVVSNNSKGGDCCSQWSLCCSCWHQCCSNVVSWHQSLKCEKSVNFVKGWYLKSWFVERLINYDWKVWFFCWIGIDFWKAELCWYDAWRITRECIRGCCKVEFVFWKRWRLWQGWLKNLYLSNLTSIPNDLKFIRKFFQISTTSLLMISRNSNDFKGKLRFEVE